MINVNSFRCCDFLENSYLLYDSKGNAALIDPGFYYENERIAIDSYIHFLGIKIQKVLLTHAHLDHILGCSYIMSKYNVPVYVHNLDMLLLKNITSYAATLNYYLEDIPDRYVLLSESDEIFVGNLKIDVIHTPGHTPGSVSFLQMENKTLFSGDVLYHNDIGRTDLLGGNYKDLSKSIRSLFALDGEIRIFPGHGPETSIGYERNYNTKAFQTLKKLNGC